MKKRKEKFMRQGKEVDIRKLHLNYVDIRKEDIRYKNNQMLKMEDNFKENNTRKANEYIKGISENYKSDQPARRLRRQVTGESNKVEMVWKDQFENLVVEIHEQRRTMQELPTLQSLESYQEEQVLQTIKLLTNNSSGIGIIPGELLEGGDNKMVRYCRQMEK